MENIEEKLVTIPARLNSSRLPDKMVRHVGLGHTLLSLCVRRVLDACEEAFHRYKVVVAVDSLEMARKARLSLDSSNYQVVETKENHLNGTSRVSEAIEILNLTHREVILVQGDELEVSGEDMIQLLERLRSCDVSTLVREHDCEIRYEDPNSVHCWCDEETSLLVDMYRDAPRSRPPYDEHVGVYAWKTDALAHFGRLVSGSASKHSIELLTALDYGLSVKVHKTQFDYFNVNTHRDWWNVLRARANVNPIGD